MNKKYLLCFFVFLVFALNSCNKSYTHEQYVSALVGVQKPVKMGQYLFANYMQATKGIMYSLQANDWKHGDTAYIDSINKASLALKAYMEESIPKIELLEETDKDLKIKEQTILHFKNGAAIYGLAPYIVKICRDGIKQADKERLGKFAKDNQEIVQQAADLLSLLHDFQEKHNITDAELDKAGL